MVPGVSPSCQNGAQGAKGEAPGLLDDRLFRPAKSEVVGVSNWEIVSFPFVCACALSGCLVELEFELKRPRPPFHFWGAEAFPFPLA